MQIRYHIEAARNERVAQYNEMVKELKQAGFVLDASRVEETDPEDNAATRLYGTVSADKGQKLLSVRNVRTALLTPASAKPPADKAAA